MAVSLIATIQRWKGLSTDEKPFGDIRGGSTFQETNHPWRQFVWLSNGWVEDLSEPLSISKAVDIGNAQRRLLEQILIENIATRELIAELLAVTKGA